MLYDLFDSIRPVRFDTDLFSLSLVASLATGRVVETLWGPLMLVARVKQMR